ncbi:MAG: HAMP domain-containing methyl-accepting chemotaxis protein [Solirubrobacteraceae bacterium]
MDDVAVGPPGATRPARHFALSHYLGIRGRLVALVVVLAATASVCVAVAVGGMLATRAKADTSYSAFKASQVERSAFEGWITDDSSSNDAVAAQPLREPQLAPAEWRQIEGGYAQALTGVNWLVRDSPTAAVRLEAARTRAALTRYNSYTRRFHTEMLTGSTAQATGIVTASAGAANTVQSDFLATGKTLSLEAGALAAGISNTVNQAVLWVSVVGLVALLVAFLFTGAVVRSITKPLRRITRAAETLATGDVEVDDVDFESRDEIGQMARAFRGLVQYRQAMSFAAREVAAGNLTVVIEPRSERDQLGIAFADMCAKVIDLLRQISSSSSTVGSASAQIARSGQQTGMAVGEIAHAVGSVAEGAEIQVRSLAEARQVTDEVATASQLSAADAQETVTAARQTRAVAEEGAAAVERATEVMRAVQASSVEITRTIHELGATSQEIGGIVDTITAVTKQTNLLALNAAIEAARAGEQGRGFAVVADHVRELAEQSRQAAETIGGLIAQIQSETGTAVEVVADGARRTEEGVATVEQAREAFLRIDASVADMNGRVQRIAGSIEQIASSGARMQESVDEVLAVAEESSASAQQVSVTAERTSASTAQIAASAEALAGTAEELERLLSHFTLA